MDPGKLVKRSARDVASNAAAQAEFNEKRRVWIPDTNEGFLAGWIKSAPFSDSDPNATAEVVITASNETRTVPLYSLAPMNPPQFDGVDDIADLTHLNEASVINNLKMRYMAGNIYTYSGLFLISLNPYRNLPIYTPRIIAQYRTKRREENPPHIFAVAERAWQQIGEERESQSILITGESGAGKTENTKKVIQYLAAIATSTVAPLSSFPSSSSSSSLSKAPASGLPRSSSFKGKESSEIDLSSLSKQPLGLLEQQILQANPILEAFGNAQTMRNNNSSRFGKFIRIFFNSSGAIAGANIDWYLLEKSRVTRRASGERSFHVFYQLLEGAKEAGLADKLLLSGGPEKYAFLKDTRHQIDGVDDLQEWRLLKDALRVVGFTTQEQLELFRVPAVILHISNLLLSGSSSDQAFLPPTSQPIADKICHLLGIPVKDFTRSVLSPKVKAGREWVTQARTRKQAEDELGALCKFMYEKTFGWMVTRINEALDRPSAKALSIGVLDIAGFEIFEENSYEQLLINFTNEKLQQFFNFHMFTLEQEEYAREGIDWNYVNFGLDLQPTIELIESTLPVGILSCLDEECIMPKATDSTFTEKVQNIWEPPRNAKEVHPGSTKIKHSRFATGFIVKHYAGDVEYKTDGWLEKNKDPINDAVARLLSSSEIPAIASLFAEYAEDAAGTGVVKKVKRGAFRTVGQRHKEQLNQLMNQLKSTQPHFVRCIVPNNRKKAGEVHVNLVLDQLRCNGVLEGIRIARLGYPNRHSFAEFRSRYEVLTPGIIPKGTYIDGRQAAERIAEALEIEEGLYKIGATKIFFKAGVLADLEERRDNLLTDLFKRFQSAAKMYMARRRILKLINRSQAIKTIQRNARIYTELRDWPWWSLYVKVRPLLAATRIDEGLIKKQAELAMAKERAEREIEEKKKLELLRLELVAEKEKVEQQLDSERQLALDKDRMLERSKAREGELVETIKQLEGDLDVLDRDREMALVNAEKAKEQLLAVQNDFDQLLKEVELLEKEANSAKKREADLLKDSQMKLSGNAKLETERKGLEEMVQQLKRDITAKEEGVKKAKERADLNLAELEKRLQLEKSKAESEKSQSSAVSEDMRKLKVQLEDLQGKIRQNETTISQKAREIAELEKLNRESAKSRQDADRAISALRVKIDTLTSDITAKEREKEVESSARRKLEKELDDLRKIMADKSSEDIKRQEVDKSRESEMTRLREQVQIAQKNLDDQREQSQVLSNKLRVDFEGIVTRYKTSEQDLKMSRESLEGKEKELGMIMSRLEKGEGDRRAVEAELSKVRDAVNQVEKKLQSAEVAKDQMSRQLTAKQSEYEALEDAVLEIESEKADWAKRMESTTRQLMDESAARQHFEKQMNYTQLELTEYRNSMSGIERELLKSQGDIKERDKEIALLRSRENKTIVEHVHVLETAKKFAERQLHEQVNENKRLNGVCKNLEAQRNRLQGDLEDSQRQLQVMISTKSKEARKARISMTHEERDADNNFDDERRARLAAEAKVASMEIDLADYRRQLSNKKLGDTGNIAARSSISGLESKLQRRDEELTRFKNSHDATLAHNQRLQLEIQELQRSSRGGNNENVFVSGNSGTPSRADLLRGLEKSHDALGRDMNEQLRKLDAQPLTPSRRHNASLTNGQYPQSPGADAQYAKRVRQLETEINGLRQQLEDEREEKEFMYQRVNELEGGEKSTGPFPFEQAMYSHFRLKAKSLRSQLDHWLAMEDLQNQKQNMPPNHSGMPSIEDVQRLKELLSQLEPESSPLKHVRS